jgi:hypothetical protein
MAFGFRQDDEQSCSHFTMTSLRISADLSSKIRSFCYCSAESVVSETPYAEPQTYSLFGPAPLLPGEQDAEYATHVARIVAVAKPRDAIEEILTRDAIDLTWEILRLRRMKVGLLRASMGSGIESIMKSLGYLPGLPEKLLPAGPPEKRGRRMNSRGRFRRAQLTMEDVMAKTLEGKIDSF